MRTHRKKKIIFKQEKNVDRQYGIASELAKLVVERSYPQKMLQYSELSKESMVNLVMLLPKINAFTLHTRKMLMMRDNKWKLNHTLILVCLAI
jgi:hypothetical protein